MRVKIMIVISIFVLGILNFSIYQNQKIINNGDVVFLELAPVDPRSLMQGDYMHLRYALELQWVEEYAQQLKPYQKRGYMVIRVDANNVAQFDRFYNDGGLESGEKILRFHKKYNSVRIVPDSFLFQEGHAQYYENAKYGVFKFDGSGKYLLTDLADDDRNVIKFKD